MLMNFTVWILAQMALDQGHVDRAARIISDEGAAVLKERDAQMLWVLALVKQHEGDYHQAQGLLEESLAKFRAWGYKWGMAITLYHLGRLARDRAGERTSSRNDDASATAYLRESIILNSDLGNKLGIAKALVEFGCLALAQGDSDRSARLFAAAETLHQTIGAPMPSSERMQFERGVAQVQALHAEPTFATIWNAGKNMTTEEAVRYALQEK
jgi:tetratricopeptide (TPR) repeat protein